MNLNKEKALKELGIDETFYNEIIQAYMKQFSETLDKLSHAVETDDFDTVAKMAHLIKGSSGNLRIEEVRCEAELLEKNAKTDLQKEFAIAQTQKLRGLHEELTQLIGQDFKN